MVSCCEVGQAVPEGPSEDEIQRMELKAQQAQERKDRDQAQRLAELYVLSAVQRGEWSKAGEVRAALERRASDREICRAAAKAAENIATQECGLDALVETGCLQYLAQSWQKHATDTGLAVPVQTVAARFWERACRDHDWYHRDGPRATAVHLLSAHRAEWLAEMHRVAVELHKAGHKGAEDAYKLAIENFSREYGSTNRVTLQAQNNLAVLLEENLKFAEAEQIYAMILNACKQVPGLPENNADALSCKFNLAALKARQGDLRQAETLYREVAMQRQRALGCQDQDALRATSNLAGVLQRQGTRASLQEAEKLLQEITDERQKLYGKWDPRVLKSRCSWALVAAQQSTWLPAKLLTAEEMLKIVVDESRANEKLGKDHPDTLVAMSHLAFIMWEKNPKSDSVAQGSVGTQGLGLARCKERTPEQLNEEVWQLMDLRVAEELRRSRSSSASIAADLPLETAKQMLEKVVERRRQHLSAEHPDVLQVRSQLALLRARSGQLEARQELEDLVQAYEANVGKFHVDTLVARVAMSQVLLQGAFAFGAGERELKRAQARRWHAETVSRFPVACRSGSPPKPGTHSAHQQPSKYAVLKRE